MKRIILSLMAALSLCASALAAEAPKREFRSAWMAGMAIDWPKTKNDKAAAQQELRDYLDNFKRQNFTGVCIHVRPNADAYYKSTLEPWSADFTGTRGKDPGWDPLAFAVEECHKRGLECYAWCNPFRLTSGSTAFTTPQDKEWIAKGWIMWGVGGSWRMFNPGIEEARRHCLDVFKEIYTNYDVDGLLFDDYFYPSPGMPGAVAGSGSDSDSSDYDTWTSSGSELSLYDWRRNNVNTFVKELYDEIQAERPDMRFGIGPAGVGHYSASKYGLSRPNISSTDWQYDKIYADCLAWLADGSIDFISPQIYWARGHSTAPHGPLSEWWNMAADHFGRHCYVSIAAYKVYTSEFGGNGTKGWSEIASQVDLSRQYTLNNSAGQIYYNTQSINGPAYSGLGDYLGENSYETKSLVPKVTWKERVIYPAVSSLTYSGGTLSWDATKKEGRAIVRYTVYAVPSDKTHDEAQAADGDGFDAQYLVDVTYSPSYTLPSDKTSGYWYAVCVYDGYGFESEPSYANYSADPSEKAELLSPRDGEGVEWDARFSWTAVKDATYSLQISSSAEFNDIEYQASGLTEASAEVSVDCVKRGPGAALCYWRVSSTQPGKLASYSDAETFRIPARKPAPTGTPLSPADDVDVDQTSVEFRWTPPTPEWADCGYKLSVEVLNRNPSGDYSQSTPIYSSAVEPETGVCSVSASIIGTGEFVWRLKAEGDRWTTAYSDVKPFRISKLSVGIYEKGYEVKTDDAGYAKKGDFSLESIWYRSVHSPYNNMTFELDGSLQRGMVAVGDRVYVSGRAQNAYETAFYLSEYDGDTGEHIRDIELSEEGKVLYYPCNDVIKDSKGNVCITNLTLNTKNNPVVIFKVDLETGGLTKVATLQTDATSTYGRVDHVGIYGDVTSGEFKVFMAIASKDIVYRFSVTSPTTAAVAKYTISSFYPSDAEHFGIAPKVYPVDDYGFYVDGGTTGLTLYRSGNMAGSFADAVEAAPQTFGDNGMTAFSLGDTHFIAYNYSVAAEGSQFALSKLAANHQFAGMELLWALPANSFGTVVSTACSTPVDVVVKSENEANLYLYSPGNGLAAYRLRKSTPAGVESVADGSTDGLSMRVAGLTVIFDREVAEVSAYTASGVLVATASDVSSINLPGAGAYIVKAGAVSRLVLVR